MQQLQHIHVEEKPVPNFIVQQVKQVLVPDRPSLPQMSSSTYLSSNALAQHSNGKQSSKPKKSISSSWVSFSPFASSSLSPSILLWRSRPQPSTPPIFLSRFHAGPISIPHALSLSFSLSSSLYVCAKARTKVMQGRNQERQALPGRLRVNPKPLQRCLHSDNEHLGVCIDEYIDTSGRGSYFMNVRV